MYKISKVLVDKKLNIKRFYKNQFNTAYKYDTYNENYKQLQNKLYRLGYDVKIDGDFSRLNMVDSVYQFNRDTYKTVFDWDGITYYSLYRLLYDMDKKIEIETNNYNIESYCNYSFLTSSSDYNTDYKITFKNKNKIIFLNPLDEFGERIIKSMFKILNFYNTNYIDCKQTNFQESQKDRVNRILEYIDTHKEHKNPIVINVGRSIDYNSNTTLLRGINIYNNYGIIDGNYKKILTYSKYFTNILNRKLSYYFEYTMNEQNDLLPLLKNFNDIPSIQIELGYANNPIDKMLHNDNNVLKYLVHSLVFAVQRIVTHNVAQRYTKLDNIELI